MEKHPLTHRPLWREILAETYATVSDSCSLDEQFDAVVESWPKYLDLLSWWQLKRYYNRAGGSITCKPRADVVVVHPAGRFTRADTQEQWLDSCVWTLLGFCNHGDGCQTFKDKKHLDDLPAEQVEELMQTFATSTPEERRQRGLVQCPPHICKKWQLGLARKQRKEERKLSTERVVQSMRKIHFVFHEEPGWMAMVYADMSADEQALAKTAWKDADNEELAEAKEAAAAATGSMTEGTLCELSADDAIRARMKDFMLTKLKWTHRELHDAVLSAGMNVPGRPSLINYFNTLRLQFGDSKAGFLPQAAQSHTKKRIQDVLRCLGRSGIKLGGKIADPKPVLAERLARWLGKVVEVGREQTQPEGRPQHKVLLVVLKRFQDHLKGLLESF